MYFSQTFFLLFILVFLLILGLEKPYCLIHESTSATTSAVPDSSSSLLALFLAIPTPFASSSPLCSPVSSFSSWSPSCEKEDNEGLEKEDDEDEEGDEGDEDVCPI